MKRLLATTVIAILLPSCAMTGNSSKTGMSLIMNLKESESATSLESSSKSGKACSQNIIGLISMGDSSVRAAKKNGGITKVATVDTEYFKALGFYGEVCTIVSGE